MLESTKEQKEKLEKDLAERVAADKLPVAKIMVAGITGTGKSTLINAVFGKELAETGSGRPVTEHIDEYQNEDIPIHIWDTVGLELDSEKTKESINSIKKTITLKAESNNPYDRIHAIWYCINSGSNRYQGAELEFIKELYSMGVPFIIVLTQCSGDEDEVNKFENEIKKINASMGMNNIEIVQVLAKQVKYRGIAVPIPEFGLDDLVNTTLRLLPEFIKSGFVAAQRINQIEKRKECEKIIYEYVSAVQSGLWRKIAIINVYMTDKKIMNMFQKIGQMYNTVLSEAQMEKIMSTCNVDFANKFWGLISPISMGYSKKITNLLERKKAEGFSVAVADIKKNERAARMVAFYGYIFIESIEELWEKSTDEKLEDVDVVVNQLITIINEKLRERKAKVERR